MTFPWSQYLFASEALLNTPPEFSVPKVDNECFFRNITSRSYYCAFNVVKDFVVEELEDPLLLYREHTSLASVRQFGPASEAKKRALDLYNYDEKELIEESKKVNVHSYVWSLFRDSGDTRMKKISYDLHSLRLLRNKADYEAHTKHLKRDATAAFELATKIVDGVKELE